jgi:AcrR family transcriptional regulator
MPHSGSTPSAPASAHRADWRHYTPLELTPVLSAALEVFYEHGFHGTTVRDIARRSGQTVPSLYYHHASKEGAFADLLEFGTREVAWRIEAAVAEAGERSEVQLAYVVEAIALHMTHRVRLAALDQELRHLSPDNRKRYAARRKEIETLLGDIIEAGAEEGMFYVETPRETARAVLGMLQSIARWYHPDGPLTPTDIANRYIDIAMNTVCARRSWRGKGSVPWRAHLTASGLAGDPAPPVNFSTGPTNKNS